MFRKSFVAELFSRSFVGSGQIQSAVKESVSSKVLRKSRHYTHNWDKSDRDTRSTIWLRKEPMQIRFDLIHLSRFAFNRLHTALRWRVAILCMRLAWSVQQWRGIAHSILEQDKENLAVFVSVCLFDLRREIDRMDDRGGGLDRLHTLGVFGLTREAFKLMRQNSSLFLSFVTSFTIPCSLFTIFLFAAVDVHHRYVIDDFISKGELVIFGWKFETLISSLALNFGFIFLNLIPVAWLNTAVCNRGVISIYRNEDLTTSVKNSFLNVQWAVLRLIVTQFILYFSLVIILGIALVSETPSPVVSLVSWILSVATLAFLYHLPTPPVAILEPGSYGFRGVYRAMELAYSKLSTFLGLAFFSLSYFCLLKLFVDTLLKDSYPFWTKFVVYPPLVLSVIVMSIFWQVVYTLFYLSSSQVDLDKVDLVVKPDLESRDHAADISQPLLVDEVERNDNNSDSQNGTV